jgi:hypothetical protein
MQRYIAWLGTFSNSKQEKWLGTQDLRDESAWEASIFQTISQHADLVVQGRYSIEELTSHSPTSHRMMPSGPSSSLLAGRSILALHLPQRIKATVPGSDFQLELYALEPAARSTAGQ